MEDKSSDFDKRPAIGKLSLKEVVDKLLRRAKEEMEEREKEIHQKVKEYAAQKAMKAMDISLSEKQELAARVAEEFKDKIVKSFRESLTTFDEASEEVLDKERRMDRSLQKGKEAIEDISEFSLQEAFGRHLRDIRRSKEKKGKEA